MKRFEGDMVITIPYVVQAVDSEQAVDFIEEIFEEEYPDLKIFTYNITKLRETE